MITTLGAAAAATTALAAPADAQARYAVWNRVASCESSNNWHINTGNGYYGGLQFSSSTWASYNGHKYASQANEATRLEQIEVARRVLHAQGPYAWPVCGPQAGLTTSSGHATGAALPANPAAAEHHVRAHAHQRHVHVRDLHNPRHHAEHHGRHEHHGQHRAHHARHRSDHLHHYRVRAGDTLSKIAERHHVHGGWRHLWRLNEHRLSSPDLLRIGQILLLP